MSSRTRTQEPTTQDPGAQDEQATGAGDQAATPPAVDECNVDECTKPARNRGLCDGHWASRRGDATPRTAEDRDE